MERRLAAILFTDVVGYTDLMGQDEEAGRRVRARHERLVREQVKRFLGQWIEEKGDESLSIFSSALDAVHCALAIQKRLVGDRDLQLRIGIHLGDVSVEDGRVYGDGVNVAARVRPVAEPGGVCISQPVRDSIRNQPHLVATSLGVLELKGVAEGVELFTVAGEAIVPGRPAAGTRAQTGRFGDRHRLAAVAALVLALLAAALWLGQRQRAVDSLFKLAKYLS